MTPALEAIRASRYAIGGYAARFGHAFGSKDDYPDLQAGAFSRLLASTQEVYLLLNHECGRRPSFASRNAGTLSLEQDYSYGLWFEASLTSEDDLAARIFDLVRRRAITGLSLSWLSAQGSEMNVAGVGRRYVVTSAMPFEISLLTPPGMPRRGGTWVRPLAEALQARRAL